MNEVRTRTDVQERYYQEGLKVGEELLRAVNNLGLEGEVIQGFVEAVIYDHRTLQQGVGRLVRALLTEWAAEYEKGHYDERNQATLTWAHEAVQAGLPYLPVI